MEFDSSCLHKAIEFSKGHELVAFNERPVLPEKGNICTHFLIWKDSVAKIGGKILSEKFHHVSCDNLLWAQPEAIGEASHCEDAKIVHHHRSKAGGQMDQVYAKGWSQVEADRDILAEEPACLTKAS